jgi:WD40-like Beta Propeller Repeat
MTSPRRFEQDLPALLADLYVIGTPDYRDDLVRQTARIRQRPAWRFPERWLPLDLVTRRVPLTRVPWHAVGILALIALLIAAIVVVTVGSRRRVPAPFGLARNGPMAYTIGGDIFIRDTVSSPERILMGANGKVNFFWGFSPDGTRFLVAHPYGGLDYLFVADADGSNERPIFDLALVHTESVWSPDGRTVAVTVEVDHDRRLYLVHVDGSPATLIDLGDVQPTSLAWRPPNGAELLVRGRALDDRQDLYLMNADGTNVRPLRLPSPRIFGPDWDVSGPQWSPGGDRIAYNVVEPTTGDPAGHFRVHFIQPDGTGDLTPPGPADAVQEAWPVWSPDGQWIVVHRWTWGVRAGEGWLAVMPADGSAGARDIGPRLRGGETTGIIKTWSPDGTRILAHSDGTGETFSIDPQTGSFEKTPWTAADLPDYRRLGP